MLRQIPKAKENEKLVVTNLVSRHKTFLSRQEQDGCTKILLRQNPCKS